jgi:hypothetical protein
VNNKNEWKRKEIKDLIQEVYTSKKMYPNPNQNNAVD